MNTSVCLFLSALSIEPTWANYSNGNKTSSVFYHSIQYVCIFHLFSMSKSNSIIRYVTPEAWFTSAKDFFTHYRCIYFFFNLRDDFSLFNCNQLITRTFKIVQNIIKRRVLLKIVLFRTPSIYLFILFFVHE